MTENHFDLNNKYKTKLSFDYYPISNDVLTYYYLPLIGSEALSIYLFLITEAKNFYTNEFYLKHDRLITMLNLKAEQIDLAITKLETIGLLEIYLESTAKNKIIYVLNEPLFPTNFVDNKKLSNLLKEKIGKDYFIQNNQYFGNIMFKKNETLIPITKKIDLEKSQKNHNPHDLQTKYDFSTLFKILDSKKIDYESNWGPEFEELIKSSFIFYDLSTIDIVDIFENINQKHKISVKNFKKYLAKNGIKKQQNFEDLLNGKTNALLAKKEMLDAASPGDFFRIIIGREMTNNEYQFFKILINDFNYSNAMINRLIDYSNLANKGIINLNFIKKISDTTIKYGIDNVEKLEKHLKTANMISERNNKSTSPEVEKESTTNDSLNFKDIDFKL